MLVSRYQLYYPYRYVKRSVGGTDHELNQDEQVFMLFFDDPDVGKRLHDLLR